VPGVHHDALVIALRYVLAESGLPLPTGCRTVPNASASHWSGNGGRLHPDSSCDTARLTSLDSVEGTTLA
jgi:hypothetical protein